MCALQAIDYSMNHESHSVAEEKRMIQRRSKIEASAAICHLKTNMLGRPSNWLRITMTRGEQYHSQACSHVMLIPCVSQHVLPEFQSFWVCKQAQRLRVRSYEEQSADLSSAAKDAPVLAHGDLKALEAEFSALIQERKVQVGQDRGVPPLPIWHACTLSGGQR